MIEPTESETKAELDRFCDALESIHGEMAATYGSEKKAADEAKEMNDHLAQFGQMIKNALGPNGKDVAAALDKAKATADGSNVTAKFAVPGGVIEKLLAKEKE